MKKVLVLLLTLTLTLSMSLSVLGASDKSNNGKGKGANKSETQISVADSKALQKQFKKEMNQYVKNPLAALQGDLDTLNAAKADLQGEIDDLDLALAALDPLSQEYLDALAEKEDKVAALATLDTEIAAVNTQLATDPESLKKQFINERFMVIKSQKSGFDLSLYDNAQALVAAMYTAAQDPDAWTLWTNKSENLLKLEGPLYLKGSKIMFPLAAMRDLGAEVTWDADAKTVTVVGTSGISVVFSPEGKAATTQASVANSDIIFEDGAVAGEKVGTITGTVTDPVTGIEYDVEASVTMTFTLDPVTGEIVDESLGTSTVTADIVDPDTGEIIKTVDFELSGTLSEPVLTFDEATLDVEISDGTVTNCGRTYHPLNDLAEIFALDITADIDTGAVEVAPETVVEEV